MEGGVIIEGFLLKKQRLRGEFVRRWYRLLDNGELVWHQDKEADVKGKLSLSAETTLGPGAEHFKEELYGFALEDGKGRTRELLAPSRGDRELWLHGLCCVIAALGNDVEAVRDVRKRALRYARAAADAGDDCLRALLDAPLPGEQHDVDLQRLADRGLVVAGRAECSKFGGAKFTEKDYELSKAGELVLYDVNPHLDGSSMDSSSTGGTTTPTSTTSTTTPTSATSTSGDSSSGGGRFLKRSSSQQMRKKYVVVDMITAELVVSRTDARTVSFQMESTFVSVRCKTSAQRNDLVFASAVVGEIHRRIDAASQLEEARRRQVPVDGGEGPFGKWSVCCVTWNVNEREVEACELSTVVDAALPRAVCPDVFVVGLQEATAKLRLSAKSAERKFAKWDDAFRGVLPKDLVLFETACVGPTRIAVYLHRKNLPLVAQLRPDAVAVGAGGLPNKGAAAIAFYARGAKLVFVVAHLAAHAERVERRDADARRIDSHLLNDHDDDPVRGRLYSLPSLHVSDDDDDDDDTMSQGVGTTTDNPSDDESDADTHIDDDLDDADATTVPLTERGTDAVDALRVARDEAVINEQEERHHLRTLAETRLLSLVKAGAISEEKYDELLKQMRNYWEADGGPQSTPSKVDNDDDDNVKEEEEKIKDDDDDAQEPPPSGGRAEKYFTKPKKQIETLSLFPADAPEEEEEDEQVPVEEPEPHTLSNRSRHRSRSPIRHTAIPSRLAASHAGVLFMGDLNFRVDLDRAEAETLVKEAFHNDDDDDIRRRALDTLLAKDQLLPRLREESDFGFPTGFSEQPIAFPPTFKFDPGTHDYDTSQKQRVPAWCDRVLFAGPIVQPVAYGSVPSVTASDHRPVYAHFQFLIDNAADADRHTSL